MTTVQETATGATPLSDALAAGVNNISYNGEVTFTRYLRAVLPADGFVFWVKASIARRRSAAYNTTPYNRAPNNSASPDNGSADSFTVQGSLHWSSQATQTEDASNTTSDAIFTALQAVNDLEATDPAEMWIAEHDGRKYAFSSRFKFYKKADLHHYRGQALNSQLETQVIDSPAQLRPTQAVVSNSLPLWLAMRWSAPAFPSFAVPPNQPPPYIAIHIDPARTEALQAVPLILRDGSHWQLVKDTVRFTLYGLRNNEALDMQDQIINRAYNDDCPYGISNMPVVRDEKLTQVEMQILAQKKSLTVEVTYYQNRTQDVARQLIEQAFIAVTTGP